MSERDPFDAELEESRGSKAVLQTEIERLRKLNDEQQSEMLSWHMQLSAKDNEIKQLKHAASVDFTQWRAETVRLNAEIKRLQKTLEDNNNAHNVIYEQQLAEIVRLKAIVDGTERREAEYLALIEQKQEKIEQLAVERNHIERQLHQCDVENEARRVQWEEAKREAEKWVHESGFRLGEAHKLLQERNDEIARLRGGNTKLESENERLKAERHTTKRMLSDIIDKYIPR